MKSIRQDKSRTAGAATRTEVGERLPRHTPSDRPALAGPDVQRLLADVAPGDAAIDLGGTMSLNLRLQQAGLVLRVHRALVSRARLVALQRVRQWLAAVGLVVPAPLTWRGATLFHCGKRWAELEPYVESVRPEPSPDAYVWMFGARGALHKALASLDVAVPRPIVATYGPPTTLRRWLPAAELAVRRDSEATATMRRIHDLAYALAWIILGPDSQGVAERFPWQTVAPLLAAYETAAGRQLAPLERRALGVYTAAVPLYLMSFQVSGFTFHVGRTP